ncbi:MAG: YdcF family protein [Minwuia sp.]|nr:YdcF family protein [Minwuia sp.]
MILLQRRRTWLQEIGISFVCGGLAVLWMSSVSPTAVWLASTLERDYPPRPIAETPRADVGIVLGGALGGQAPPRIMPDMGGATDRIWLAAKLWHHGTVPRLLVVGGNLPWSPKAAPESEMIRDLLVQWGVPAAVIEIETASRNTWQNAQGALAAMRRSGDRSALLITSGTHMKRALATFRKAGLDVMPATAEVQVAGRSRFTVLDLVPNAGALNATTVALKEHLGLLVYRLLDRAE